MDLQLLAMASLGVVASVVGWVLSPRRVSTPLSLRTFAFSLFGCLLVLGAAYFFFVLWQTRQLGATDDIAVPLAWGLAAGFLVVVLAHVLSWKRESNGAVSLGLAGAAVALVGLVESEVAGRALAAAAIAAGITSVAFPGSAELRTALLFAFAVLSSIMAREAVPYSSTWQVGAVFMLAGAVGACVQSVLSSRSHRFVDWTAGFAVSVGLGALGVFRYLYVGDLFTLLLAGMGVALASWIVCEEDSSAPNSTRLLLCALLVLGAGAWAFSLRHGFGMSVLLVSAGLFSVLLGSVRALVVLSPLLSLVLLRVLIEWAGGRAAVDLGQHYVLMGFAAGALLPLTAAQWNVRGAEPWSGALWQVLVVGVPALATILLARVGVSGFLLGLMIAPLVAVLLGKQHAEDASELQGMHSAVLSTCAGLTAIFVTLVTPEGLVSRSAKVNVLLWGIGAIVVISWLLSLSSRRRLAAESEGVR